MENANIDLIVRFQMQQVEKQISTVYNIACADLFNLHRVERFGIFSRQENDVTKTRLNERIATCKEIYRSVMGFEIDDQAKVDAFREIKE